MSFCVFVCNWHNAPGIPPTPSALPFNLLPLSIPPSSRCIISPSLFTPYFFLLISFSFPLPSPFPSSCSLPSHSSCPPTHISPIPLTPLLTPPSLPYPHLSHQLSHLPLLSPSPPIPHPLQPCFRIAQSCIFFFIF